MKWLAEFLRRDEPGAMDQRPLNNLDLMDLACISGTYLLEEKGGDIRSPVELSGRASRELRPVSILVLSTNMKNLQRQH